MTETTEKPAPSRDEILQSHLVAIREEIHDIPSRIVWRFVFLGLALGVLYWLAMAAL